MENKPLKLPVNTFAHIVANHYHRKQYVGKDYIEHLKEVSKLAIFLALEYEQFKCLGYKNIESVAMLQNIIEDTEYPIEDFKNGILSERVKIETSINISTHKEPFDWLDDQSNWYLSQYENIACDMPQEVFDAVKLLTKDRLNYNTEEYFDAIKQNPLARIVKIADLIHNSNLCQFTKDYLSSNWKAINIKDVECAQEYLRWLKYLLSDE